ncbi:MAG: rRNA pseudouridine synthase [Hyphomonadaceae bacterium]|nr:rRNA pseudouridine synthase [Hyphomonadaceae bacterium]
MAYERRYDEPEPQRVNRWLAQAGVCSRREAEDLIAQGRVQIDGARVEDPGRKIAPGQTLTIEGFGEEGAAAAVSIVLNKPIGFVSAQPEPGEIPAVRLLTKETQRGAGAVPDRTASLPALGRLDKESRGLLILSSDGVLAKAIIGPASRIDKEYVVEVTGFMSDRKLALLRHGLELDGRRLKPAQVTLIGAHTLRFVLNEGRKRQIRRMCDLVDLHVSDLLRVRIGPLHLSDLPEGKWRYLTPAERAALIGK